MCLLNLCFFFSSLKQDFGEGEKIVYDGTCKEKWDNAIIMLCKVEMYRVIAINGIP